MKRAMAVLTTLLAFCLPMGASEIRVSLLNDEKVLNETADLLRANGSSADSVEGFKKAVRFHKTDLFDASSFSKPDGGFYSFETVAKLNQAIPDPFCQKITTNDLAHTSLTCLDVVVLLIKDAGAKAPMLRENFANKHFAKQKTVENSNPISFIIDRVSSPDFYKDGRTLLYPANGYTIITGLTRSSNEVDLAISLKGERQMPSKFEDTDAAITRLFTEWTQLQARDGLQFPGKLNVVFCGYIPMKYRYWAIDHVAICFERDGKLIYLEKNGPRGPFVRADFNNEDELGEFMANKLIPYSRDPKEINLGAPVFVAINNRLIRIARP